MCMVVLRSLQLRPYMVLNHAKANYWLLGHAKVTEYAPRTTGWQVHSTQADTPGNEWEDALVKDFASTLEHTPIYSLYRTYNAIATSEAGGL